QRQRRSRRVCRAERTGLYQFKRDSLEQFVAVNPSALVVAPSVATVTSEALTPMSRGSTPQLRPTMQVRSTVRPRFGVVQRKTLATKTGKLGCSGQFERAKSKAMRSSRP